MIVVIDNFPDEDLIVKVTEVVDSEKNDDSEPKNKIIYEEPQLQIIEITQ